MIGFVFRLIGRVIGFVVKATLFVGALIVVAAGTMYALFDGEQYKRAVTRHVVDVTGRTLAIAGPAELQFGLPPRIILHDVRIGNPSWSRRPEMGRIRRVEIEINPLRALAGESAVGELRLEGADVTLETSPQGQGNWQIAQVGGPVASSGVAIVDGLGLIGTPTSVVISNPVIQSSGSGPGPC